MKLLPMAVVAGLSILLTASCSLVTVEQKAFAPQPVTAKRPPKKPPRVVLTGSSIQIKEKVQFEVGSDVLLDASSGLLNEVAAVMKENEQIELVQVEGHTDSTGSKSVNKKLSNGRAKSVVKYLVSQGIDKKRLKAVGFGPDRPISDNATDEGREANRRVEFNILKQGPKKTLVEDE